MAGLYPHQMRKKYMVMYYDLLHNTGKGLQEISEKQVGIVITLHILSENAS